VRCLDLVSLPETSFNVLRTNLGAKLSPDFFGAGTEQALQKSHAILLVSCGVSQVLIL
jgi:hypothetical protein